MRQSMRSDGTNVVIAATATETAPTNAGVRICAKDDDIASVGARDSRAQRGVVRIPICFRSC